MVQVTRKQIYKNNCIELARHHRKHCDGEHCNISLMLLAEMLSELEIILTEEELKEFV